MGQFQRRDRHRAGQEPDGFGRGDPIGEAALDQRDPVGARHE